MTVLNQETIEHVANLARLELTEDEKVRYTRELSNIIQLIEQLNDMDVSQIELELDTSQETFFRDDAPHRRFNGEDLLKNAPEPEDGFYRVPQILEN